jgi:hypothetical protein
MMTNNDNQHCIIICDDDLRTETDKSIMERNILNKNVLDRNIIDEYKIKKVQSPIYGHVLKCIYKFDNEDYYDNFYDTFMIVVKNHYDSFIEYMSTICDDSIISWLRLNSMMKKDVINEDNCYETPEIPSHCNGFVLSNKMFELRMCVANLEPLETFAKSFITIMTRYIIRFMLHAYRQKHINFAKWLCERASKLKNDDIDFSFWIHAFKHSCYNDDYEVSRWLYHNGKDNITLQMKEDPIYGYKNLNIHNIMIYFYITKNYNMLKFVTVISMIDSNFKLDMTNMKHNRLIELIYNNIHDKGMISMIFDSVKITITVNGLYANGEMRIVSNVNTNMIQMDKSKELAQNDKNVINEKYNCNLLQKNKPMRIYNYDPQNKRKSTINDANELPKKKIAKERK